MQYVVMLLRDTAVTDAERLGLARLLGGFALPEPARVGVFQEPRADRVVAVVSGDAVGPVREAVAGVRGVLGPVAATVRFGGEPVAAAVGGSVDEQLDAPFVFPLDPITGPPDVPAALADAIEAAALGAAKPAAPAGIKRLLALIESGDPWSFAAERVLAVSNAVDVATNGLQRMAKGAGRVAPVVSAAVERGAEPDAIAATFRDVWDKPKSKFHWQDLRRGLSQAAVDRLARHPALRAWLVGQLDVAIDDEKAYRRVTETAALLAGSPGKDVGKVLHGRFRDRQPYAKDRSWSGMANQELFALLQRQGEQPELAAPSLILELGRRPERQDSLEDVERAATCLVELVGDDAWRWLDRMLSARSAHPLVLRALIRHASDASIARLRAFARDPVASLRDAARAELDRRGVPSPSDVADDVFALYSAPPFSPKKLPPALDEWWTLTMSETRALQAFEIPP